MQFYNADLSPNCLRARAVAFELGAPIEIVNVDLFKGGGGTPEFLKLNPNGKVPVLVDEDLVLWESRAITAYLAERFPEAGLYPKQLKKRAKVDQWSYWQAVHLGPSMQKVTFQRVLKPRFGMGEPDLALAEEGEKETMKALGVLEGALGEHEWVTGALTIADFALASTFTLRDATGLSLAALPHTAAWLERIEARPSWQKAVEPILRHPLFQTH